MPAPPNNDGGLSTAKSTAIGAGIGGLASLFTSNPYTQQVGSAQDRLKASSADSASKASSTYQSGAGGIDALQAYLKPLINGDSQALTQAASSDVARITDQYDSAYQSISQLGPRGGGRTSALATLRGKEASDVSGSINSQRDKAITQEQSLIQTLFGFSSASNAQSQTALNEALQSLTNSKNSTDQSNSDLGATIGTIAMLALLA